MLIQYVINPPKMVGNSLYYKDIVVYAIEDDIIIGANSYDYNFKATPVSILDAQFDKRLSTNFGSFKGIDTAVLTNNPTRKYWIFDTEYEAFIQKIICLKKLRETYNNNEKENRQIFNTRIPDSINSTYSKILEKHPEYFL